MMQLNLTGFLESHSPEFMKELWKLLLRHAFARTSLPSPANPECSAQTSIGGAPEEFLRKKREELLKKHEEEQKNVAAIQRTLKPSEAGYGLVASAKGDVYVTVTHLHWGSPPDARGCACVCVSAPSVTDR